MSERREYWRRVIFEHDTPAGKAFDVLLIVAIIGSVCTVIADSLKGLSATTYAVLYSLEWTFTLLFTVEYIARLWCTDNRRRYAFSFFGIVDLLATLPTYISIVFQGESLQDHRLSVHCAGGGDGGRLAP